MMNAFNMNRHFLLLILVKFFLLNNSSYSQSYSGIISSEFIFEKAPFKSCHASTVSETPDGLVAAWFGGTHEKHKDVEIWVSRYNGSSWSAPVNVADGIDGDHRFPTWNPVLYQVPDGDLLLFYKVGPSPSEWWGMLKRSNDHGKTWSEARRLPEGILGPIKNKPILLKQGRLLCPSSTESDGWKVQMEMTNDFGNSWGSPVYVDQSTEFSAIQPTIISPRNGALLQILCRSKEGKIVTSFSSDQGETWSALQETDLPNPNSGIDAVTHSNGKHYLVYNHTTVEKGKWGGARSPLNLAVTIDGVNWEALLVLERDPGEYSYPAIIESGDGLLHVTYTYNRNRIKHLVIDPSRLKPASLDTFNK